MDKIPLNIFVPLIFISILISACYGSSFMLVEYTQILGFDPTVTGNTISSGVIVTLLFSLFSVRIAQKIGIIASLVTSAIFISLAMLCFALMDILPTINYLGGALLGAGWAIFYIIAPILIIQLTTSTSRIKYLTYLSGAQMLGLGLAKPLGSLLSLMTSYATTYYIFSIIALISALMFLLTNHYYGNKHLSSIKIDALSFSAIKAILKSKTIIPIIVIGLAACSFSGLASFQILYTESRDLDANIFFIVFTIVTVILRFSIASTLSKIRSQNLFAIFLLCMIILSLLCYIYLSNSPVYYIITTVLFAAGYGLSYSTLNACAVNAAEIQNQSITTTSQVFTMFYFLGIFGFPYIAGQVIFLAGINQLLLVLVIVSIIAALLMFITNKQPIFEIK